MAVVVILCPAVWAQGSPPETAGTEQSEQSEQVLFEIPA